MKQNTLKVIFWLDENIMENTENSKIEDNNTENEEELNKGAKKEDTSMQIGAH